MGKQFTVTGVPFGASLPNSTMYTVGNVVILTDLQFADLPSWYSQYYSGLTSVTDPAPDPNWTSSVYTTAASSVQKIAIVGDSISANSGSMDVVTPTNNQFWGVKGWASVANSLTGARCQWIAPGLTGPGSLADPNGSLHSSSPSGIGFCLGGLSTQEMLTYGYMAAAVASAANIIIVHGGTNDCNNGTDATTISNNLLTMWRMATAVGKRVIATTILPRDSTVISGTKLAALNLANRLIRQNASSEPGVYLCDWHSPMLDANGAAPSGGAASAWFLDGLHPNGAGSWRMGTTLATTLNGLLNQRTPSDYLLIDTGDVLTPNPYATGNVSGVATSWTVTNVGSPTSITSTKVARTDLIPGAWQQVVSVAATANTDGWNVQVTDSTTATWNTGDFAYAFAEIQADASGWDCRGMQLDVVKSGVATIASANNIASAERTALTTNLGPAPTGGLILVTPRVQLDASLTAVRAVLRFFGSGTIRVGRMGVIKV